MSINVNIATKEDLKQIPGIGEKVAQLIIQFREIYGVVKKEALNLAVRGNLSSEALEMIDFSVPRPDNPFDIDLSCLPSVPNRFMGAIGELCSSNSSEKIKVKVTIRTSNRKVAATDNTISHSVGKVKVTGKGKL